MTSPRFAPLMAMLSMCTFMLVGAVGCGDDGKNPNSGQPQCSDGIDNDGDGMTDFPEDPGCTSMTDDSEDSPPAAQCMDGRDNDGDGKMDYPDDPGCSAPNQDDETDDCPNGPQCPACSNGKDDDTNGTTDYPDDPGCTSAADPTERTEDPNACGAGLTVKELPTSGMDDGTFDASMSSSTMVSPCGEDAGAPAVAYRMQVDVAATLVATTNVGGSTTDTVVDIRGAMCTNPTSELVCNDDTDTANQIYTSTAQIEVTPGTYFILVKAHTATETGAYSLQVNLYKHSGDACTDVSECAPGATCRIPHGQTDMVCFPPVCNDGIDDDDDGKMDYPNDPGCTSPTDDTEDDDCLTTKLTCPACGDGADNDNDGHIDYPADSSCTSAAGGSESCSGEQDPIDPITGPTTMTTLVGMHDDRRYPDSCADGGFGADGGLDRMFTLNIPKLSSLKVDNVQTGALDIILSILPASCGTQSLACGEDYTTGTTLTTGQLPAGVVIIYADAYSSSTTPGPFQIHVSGVLAPGASCEAANTLGGAFACGAAHPCSGTAGSRVCMPTLCSDGIDNDGDGHIDYPDDPGCTSFDDTTEVDDCQTTRVTCPACGDGLDNDGDGHIDYPADTACTSASATTEACDGENDPIVPVTTGATPGDTTSAHDDRTYADICSPGFGFEAGGHDQLFQLDIPATTSLTVQSDSAFDTIVELFNSTCGEPVIACGDSGGVGSGDGTLTATSLAAGRYYAAVDGWISGEDGPFTLDVSGTLAVGATCELNKTLNGALVCPAAHPCSGTAGSKTCQ